jgi:hypothetical protein
MGLLDPRSRRHLVARAAARLLLVLGVALMAGCAAQPGSTTAATATMTPSTSPTPSARMLQPGAAVSPPPRPDAAACRDLLVADVGAAKRIRAELHVEGVPATDAAVSAAAADPSADTATLGIPLTASELTALRASGNYLDRSTLVLYWVQVGEPGRFGGVWIDPPGSGRLVVAILDGDPAAATLARCLEPGSDVAYVAATTSLEDLNALNARISSDMGELRSGGVQIQSVGLTVRGSTMVVVVGVTGLTDAIRADLVGRYGDTIVVEEQAPIAPA